MSSRTSIEPLYIQVKNDILSQILSGSIKVGDKLMSESEMMQHYSVGRVTIRAALAELAVTGCLKKEQGLGTFCVAIPSAEKRPDIDVLLNCNDTYIVPSLLMGINTVLEAENCNLLLHDVRGSFQETGRILESILQRGTDGVIIQYPRQEDGAEPVLPPLERLRQLEIPVVTLCGSLSESCASLQIDDHYGAHIAAQYLLDCGHSRVLALFPETDFGVEARFESTRSTLAASPGVSFHSLRTSDVSGDAERLLQLVVQTRVSAIICYNDFYAVQCMHVLQEAGYRIPEDISLIGFDDTPLSTSAVPQLTSVSHPKDHMGSDAAHTILHWMRGSVTKPSKTIYRPELVIRQSVCDLRSR